MKNIQEYIRSFIPFEFKRPTSLISLFLSLVIIGFFSKIGENLLELILNVAAPFSPEIFKYIKLVATYTIPVSVNLLTIIIFVVLLFPIYRFFDKSLLSKLKQAIVFEDTFEFGNRGWHLNYWGSNNPDKTCRIENSNIVFEAIDSDIIDTKKEFGAYYDLRNGVYQDCKYEISCWLKSDPGTTMGFKLWVHDTQDRSEVKQPSSFYTPGNKYEEVKIKFIATQSQALRIHLHIKAGKGRIYIDKVKVVKIV